VTSVAIDVSAVPARPAGAGRYVVEVARRVTRIPDLEVALITRRRDGDRWRSLAPSGQVVAAAPSARPARVVWEEMRLAATAASAGAGGRPVEVLHSPHYTMPRRAAMPVVVTVHDLTFFDHPEWHERSKVVLFRHAVRRAAKQAAAIVCVSQGTADRLCELLRPAVPVYVVPHGVDTDRFTAVADPTDRQVVESFQVREPYLLHVGTIEPRKDVPSLLAAFDRLAGADADLSLVLAGTEGWGTAAVDMALAGLVHADRVVRLGYVDDAALPPLMRRACVVAYPSLAEGFGLPVLEALACGSPLVTTSGTVMAEVVGGAALLAPPGDEASLAEAIRTARDGGPEAARRRLTGLALAAAHSWDRCADEHARIYREAAGGEPPAGRWIW
jgi:glycosyltransferase involved in cell wall biosynthesis